MSWLKLRLKNLINKIYKILSIHTDTELESLNVELEELDFEDLGLDASILKTQRDIDFADETLHGDQRHISDFRINVNYSPPTRMNSLR